MLSWSSPRWLGGLGVVPFEEKVMQEVLLLLILLIRKKQKLLPLESATETATARVTVTATSPVTVTAIFDTAIALKTGSVSKRIRLPMVTATATVTVTATAPVTVTFNCYRCCYKKWCGNCYCQGNLYSFSNCKVTHILLVTVTYRDLLLNID